MAGSSPAPVCFPDSPGLVGGCTGTAGRACVDGENTRDDTQSTSTTRSVQHTMVPQNSVLRTQQASPVIWRTGNSKVLWGYRQAGPDRDWSGRRKRTARGGPPPQTESGGDQSLLGKLTHLWRLSGFPILVLRAKWARLAVDTRSTRVDSVVDRCR